MALEYNHILVAVDGSKEAEWAFRKSIEMAKKHKASLNLIHVVDTRSFTAMTKRVPSEDDPIFEEGRALIEKYKNEAIGAGLSDVNAFVASGSPKKAISRDFAKQVDADLIICGAQGLNAFEKYLMGSVSQHIVSNSSCDVLVVRREFPAKAES